MQPGPQDPSQGAYPQFQGAPQQPGFQVVHNNPYSQPQPGYVPPPQYVMVNQYNQAPTNPNELRLRTEINLIDHRLSSGCYNCYYILLHISAVFEILNLISTGFSIYADIFNVVYFLGALISTAFVISMIDAMKNKKLDKAELGLKLALVSAVIGLVTMYFWSRYIAKVLESEEAGWTVMGLFVVFAILNLFLSIFPILKVRDRLKAREALLEQLKQPFNA